MPLTAFCTLGFFQIPRAGQNDWIEVGQIQRLGVGFEGTSARCDPLASPNTMGSSVTVVAGASADVAAEIHA